MAQDRASLLLRLPPDLLAQVEDFAAKRETTRHAALLELLGLGLGNGPAGPQENHTAALYAAMGGLKDLGLSGAEIGRIVGLSRQRVKVIMDQQKEQADA